ncbi:hypothetical protein Tco_0099496 [Tanacetum coccineum]
MGNTGPRVDKPVWDNTKRVNHQNFSKYRQLRKTFIPSGVLKRTGLITPVKQNKKRAVHKVSTARPDSSIRSFAQKIAQTSGAIRPIYPRMDNVRPRGSYSPIHRSFYTKPAFRPKDLKQDVKTFGVQNMTNAGKRAVVNTGKDSGSFMVKKGNLEILFQDHTVVDNGCSSYMTGNKAYLLDYEDFNGGFVAFGSDPKGAVPATDDSPAVPETNNSRDCYDMLLRIELIQLKKMWRAIEKATTKESLNIQDVKTNLFWELVNHLSRGEKQLSPNPQDSTKLMKELCNRKNLMVGKDVSQSLNSQNFNRMVKICHNCEAQQKVDEVSYHKALDILKQYQKEVNELRAERMAKNANPLALVATAQTLQDPYYQSSKPHKSYAPTSKALLQPESHATTR